MLAAHQLEADAKWLGEIPGFLPCGFLVFAVAVVAIAAPQAFEVASNVAPVGVRNLITADQPSAVTVRGRRGRIGSLQLLWRRPGFNLDFPNHVVGALLIKFF